MKSGALTGIGSEERDVPESKTKKLNEHVRRLHRLLGQQTEEVENPKETLHISREKTDLTYAFAMSKRFRVKHVSVAISNSI